MSKVIRKRSGATTDRTGDGRVGTLVRLDAQLVVQELLERETIKLLDRGHCHTASLVKRRVGTEMASSARCLRT